jgi:hypothetical protein
MVSASNADQSSRLTERNRTPVSRARPAMGDRDVRPDASTSSRPEPRRLSARRSLGGGEQSREWLVARGVGEHEDQVAGGQAGGVLG